MDNYVKMPINLVSIMLSAMFVCKCTDVHDIRVLINTFVNNYHTEMKFGQYMNCKSCYMFHMPCI